MVSSTTSSTNQTSASGAVQSIVKPNDQLANKETFLKLLVAQIKNQDPMNPSDGTQFLTQLAQFSALEQNMQANKNLETIQQSIDKVVANTGNSGTVDNSGTTASDSSATRKV